MAFLRPALLLIGVILSTSETSNGLDRPLPRPSGIATLYAVGDILYRTTSEGAVAVGELMETLLALDPVNSRALVAGDICNDDGRAECYERLEQTAWGPLRPLLYSVPGNHDYEDARRNGGIPYYFHYMLNAGDRERGWHAFDWGGWRVVGLNSEVMARDANRQLSSLGVEQIAWFERELQQHADTRCVLTYYHRPMFSSGRFASPKWVGPLFQMSFVYGVDFYFVAHEHMFAALPPLTPYLDAEGRGKVDGTYGIPGVIGGTGGAVLFPDPRQDPALPPEGHRLRWEAEGEVVLPQTWGVTQIDLWPGGYRWKFIPVDPDSGRRYPSGTGTCHPRPPAAFHRGTLAGQ
jgi:acid phosphatase type 7